MGRLIKVENQNDEFSIRVTNILLIAISAMGIVVGLDDWENKQERLAKGMMGAGFAAAGVAGYINDRTKTHFALENLQNNAESRQQARSIEAQETTLAADLSVAKNQRLTQLKVEDAETNADLNARLLELKHEEANLIAQLQEFGNFEQE